MDREHEKVLIWPLSFLPKSNTRVVSQVGLEIFFYSTRRVDLVVSTLTTEFLSLRESERPSQAMPAQSMNPRIYMCRRVESELRASNFSY